MSKITFCMLAFNSDHVLRPVLRALQPHGDIVCAEGPVDYWQRQGFHTSTDDTRAILCDEIGDHNVVHGQWREKDEMQRAWEPMIPDDTTHVWICDADEVMPPELFDFILPRLDEIDSAAFRCHSFYGDFKTQIGGFEAAYGATRIQRWYKGAHWATHRPPTILDPNGKAWSEHRHIDGAQCPRYFHYSQVFPSQMRAKCRYYTDRGGMVDRYWERVYVPWLLGDAAHKADIESAFAGLHTHAWSRGPGYLPCYSFESTVATPAVMRPFMPELEARLALEIAEVKIAGQ